MATISLTELLLRVRRRANVEQSSFITDSDQFVTDDEITDYINEGGSDLYGELAMTNENYNITVAYPAITTGNSITLPTDFWLLRAVGKQTTAGTYVSLRAFDLSERNDYSSPYYGVSSYNPSLVCYNIVGSTLYILPIQSALGIYELWYTPSYTNLSVGSDTIDVPQNWTDYITLYAALQVRIKENIGTSEDLQQQVDRMKIRLMGESMRRGQPRVTRRVRTAPRNWY